MRGVVATMQRELRSYFLSPLGWVVATGFLFFNGLTFQTILDYLNNPQAPAVMTPLDLFFGGTLFFWLALLFVGPVLTMRLLSEERRSGTLEMLLTAPITEGQVVIGKYLGAFLFYVFLWLPTLLYVALLAKELPLDWGPIGASYLGTLGIGAMFLAIGLFTSAVTRNQVVAAVFSFALTFLCFLPAFLEFLVNDPKMRDALGYLNLYQHMDDFSKGIVDSRRLVYYLSVSAFFLFLASRALDAGKGK
ncbi:MAG TPA: ABC transporter permease subunit [Thermoanaerobaculia bacterium]|nr:ABC transporter permease subunit [Thermoanaerobaculia bacterium]